MFEPFDGEEQQFLVIFGNNRLCGDRCYIGYQPSPDFFPQPIKIIKEEQKQLPFFRLQDFSFSSRVVDDRGNLIVEPIVFTQPLIVGVPFRRLGYLLQKTMAMRFFYQNVLIDGVS